MAGMTVMEITPDDYKRCCFETQAKMGISVVSNIIENHDRASWCEPLYSRGRLLQYQQKDAGSIEFYAPRTAVYLSRPGAWHGKCAV